MKKYFLFLLFSLAFFQNNWAQSNLKAYLSYADFTTPTDKPYIETYLTVVGNSVIYKKNDAGKFQGAVEISIVFVQNEEIKNFNKYILLSDPLENELKPRTNFIDQQRFSLENGEYTMEIEIADKNANAESFKYQEKITVNFPSDKVCISEIELIESYKPTENQNVLSKSGFDLVPYVSKYYPPNFNTLTFYTEIYNTNVALQDSEKYLVNYFIEDFDTKEKLGTYSNFTKYTAAKVCCLLHSYSIDNLHSGNYNICIEVRNRENNLLANRKLFFQRNNPEKGEEISDLSELSLEKTFVKNYSDKDSVATMIQCLTPISTVSEINYSKNQLVAGDLAMMKRYFFSFWQKRNPSYPEKEWLLYKEKVDEVNRLFSTSNRTKKGFATDRGRVYLHYGKPTVRAIGQPEPTSYPYEIWQYDVTLDNQTNRRFVFFDSNSGSNDYKLIHSEARGEVFNERWRYILQNRKINPANYNLDDETINDNSFGSQADDLYRNPR